MKKRRFISYIIFAFIVLSFTVSFSNRLHSEPASTYFSLSTDVSTASANDQIRVTLGVRNLNKTLERYYTFDEINAYIRYDATKYDIQKGSIRFGSAQIKDAAIEIPDGPLKDAQITADDYSVYEFVDDGFIEISFSYLLAIEADDLPESELLNVDFDVITLIFTAKEGATGNGDFHFFTDGNAESETNRYEAMRFNPTGTKKYFPDLYSTASVSFQSPSSTITFDSKGGSIVAPITKPIGESVSKPSNPTKTGYQFIDWYPSNDGGVTLEATPYVFDVMPSTSLTLYAKYNPITYPIRFDANGGEGSMADITATYDQSINLSKNTFTKGQDIFMGWSTTPTGAVVYTDEQVVSNLVATSTPVTLYAQWKSVYTVTLNLNGGQYNSSTANIVFTKEHNLTYGTDLITPTRVGYTFGGWYTAPTGGTKVTSTSKVTSTHTLYAVWTAQKFTVTFNTNGGSNISSIYDEFGKSVAKPADPTQVGHTFVAWYSDAALTNEVSFPFTIPANNVTLYAKWQVNSYTITFEYNDGRPTTSITQDYNSSITLPQPTRANFVFDGWYKDNNTFTQKFTASLMPINGAQLYAKWTEQHTIDFVPNNGTTIASKVISDGNALGTLPTPTKEGHTFDGWYDNASFTGSKLQSTTIVHSSMTLYAKWTAIKYKITFNSNEGSSVAVIEDFYGTMVSQPVDPTKTGHTFVGWYTNSGLTNAVSFPLSMPSNNITLYAKWQVNSYTITFEYNDGRAKTTLTQDYNSNISLPQPTRASHVFNGWFIDDGTFETPFMATKMPAGSLEVYAKWTEQHTIDFQPNNGTTIASKTVLHGNQIGTLPAPTKVGHTFEGWYDNSLFVGNMIESSFEVIESMTLYAKWMVNKYKVIFNTNAGSTIAEIEDFYGTTVNQPADPTKEGHTFAGWYFNAALTNEVNFPITIGASNTTLYAKWTTQQFTITFESNGGSTVSPITKNYNESVVLPTPTKTGYTFAGWYDNPAFSGSAYNSNQTVTESLDLFAKWTINQYTVTFHTDGGTTIAPQTVDFNASIVQPADPIKTGYTFVGWFTDLSKTIEAIFPFTVPADAVTLYAKWSINSYTIEFDSNGGQAVADITGSYNTTISLPIPTKVNSAFAGWYRDNGTFLIPFIGNKIPAEDIILYAKWVDGHTVTFHHLVNSEVTTAPVLHGETLASLPQITRTGYTFKGWYLDQNYTGQPFTTQIAINDNINLYAKWEVNSYTITFQTNSESNISNLTKTFGSLLDQPADPTKTGHSFVGWFLDAAFTEEVSFPYSVPANNVTLYAKWSTNEFVVEFESNGGSSVASKTAMYNSTIALVAPTKAGHTFAGWYEQLDLSGSAVSNAYVVTKNVTLYAKWTINSYRVTFEVNGGTPISDLTQAYNSNITKPVDPTKVGHTFVGWYKEASFTTEVPFPYTVPASDSTLYAKWEVNCYTVSFVTNGGNEISEVLATYNQEITLSTPTKSGFSFEGWYLTPDFSGAKYTNSIQITGNTVLYAKWHANSYRVLFQTNGGSVIAEVSGVVGFEVVQPVDPTKSGFVFVGWFTDMELLNEVTFPYAIPANDTTLYAKWEEAGIHDATLTTVTIQYKDVSLPYTIENDETIVVNLPYAASKIDILPTATSTSATVEEIHDLDLEPGVPVTQTILVTSSSGVEKEYTIELRRALPSNNSKLSDLVFLDPDDHNKEYALNEELKEGVFKYTVTVGSSVSKLNFAPTLEDSHANYVVKKDGQEVSGVADILPGENVFEVIVVAEDGITSIQYEITIVRAERNNNPNLKSISVIGSDEVEYASKLSPLFNSDVYSYQLTVPFVVTGLSFAGTAVESGIITGGSSLSGLMVSPQVNEHQVVVQAEDGTEIIYTFTVTRQQKSSDASLTQINVGSDTIEMENDVLTYTLDVPYAVNHVTIQPIASHAYVSSIKINQAAIQSQYSLELGENEFVIEVLAEDGTTKRTYHLNINRQTASNEATLIDLILDGVEEPTFKKKQPSGKFVDSSFDAVSQIQYIFVNPCDEIVTLNPITCPTGHLKNNQDLVTTLDFGYNIIPVTVVAEDNVTESNYFFIVYRPNYSSDTDLKSLVVENASYQKISNDIYRVHLPKGVTALDLIVETNDENATYTVYGNSHLRSDSIITIEVLAEDGVTTHTYTLFCYTPSEGAVDSTWKVIGLIAIGLSIAFAISLAITRKQYY